MNDVFWMQEALAQADRAASLGEVPVGALVVLAQPGQAPRLIAAGHNQPIATHDPSAHAEMVAIRAACARQRNYRLAHTTLYTTLEPCLMCWGAIVHARIDRVVYAADDPKWGILSKKAIPQEAVCNHQCALEGGVLAEISRDKLQAFFRAKRGQAS
jgi:tRNA(adenine34) deaminase